MKKSKRRDVLGAYAGAFYLQKYSDTLEIWGPQGRCFGRFSTQNGGPELAKAFLRGAAQGYQIGQKVQRWFVEKNKPIKMRKQ